MSSSRSDVNRLFQHFGLDPSEYLQFSAATTSRDSDRVVPSASAPPQRIADPVARAAYLRSKLLSAALR
jgi:hypothetical protein